MKYLAFYTHEYLPKVSSQFAKVSSEFAKVSSQFAKYLINLFKTTKDYFLPKWQNITKSGHAASLLAIPSLSGDVIGSLFKY